MTNKNKLPLTKSSYRANIFKEYQFIWSKSGPFNVRGSSILFSGAKRRFWHPKSVIYDGWGAEYGGLHPETVIERGSGARGGYLHPVW